MAVTEAVECYLLGFHFAFQELKVSLFNAPNFVGFHYASEETEVRLVSMAIEPV
jgi:hypothetical protein